MLRLTDNRQAPSPPENQKRKSLTPEMEEGLEKIKRIISIYSELPRGLTTRLKQFMEPFAAMATLRSRLSSDGEAGVEEPEVAPPPAVVWRHFSAGLFTFFLTASFSGETCCNTHSLFCPPYTGGGTFIARAAFLCSRSLCRSGRCVGWGRATLFWRRV